MRNSSFVIKDITGKARFRVEPLPVSSRLPTWTEIFGELSQNNEQALQNLNLSQMINETVEATAIDFSGSDFSQDSMERSVFRECIFDNSNFKPTNFHHHADKTDRLDRSMGTLFINCSFKNCKMKNCDFIMSKFINCNFDGAYIENCDFRNVGWFDRYEYTKVFNWETIPDLPDPFRKSTLKKCKFGHPMSNAMSLPVHLMIPKSFDTIWNHLGEINKKMIRFSYIMHEAPSGQFISGV